MRLRWRFSCSQHTSYMGNLACCRHCGGFWFKLEEARFLCTECREVLGPYARWRDAYDNRHIEDVGRKMREAA